jgi:hypothetical protein
MLKQLNEKLIQQDQQLLKEKNQNSPLVIQRKQLQKDIDDFNLLDKRQDARAIQQIIERVQHMALFNKKSPINEVKSTNQPSQSIFIPLKTSLPSISCSYQVRFQYKNKRFQIHFFFFIDFMSRIS